MKKILEIGKTIAAAIGIIGTIGGAAFGAYKITERMHSDKDHVLEAEQFFDTYDEKKAYGEYIMDSIEEVNTQKRWEEQQEINKKQNEKLDRLDSLLRLNVRITDETLKEYRSTH